jgi:hypothetical protein
VLYGVSRKTVHKWLHRYAAVGLRGLADRSSRPDSCPHQMVGVVEARVIEMRREHPGWGPRTIRTRLGREGVVPLPGRSSILSSSRSPSWPARSRSRLRAKVIRVHAIRHDRSKEHGAFATPHGRPRKPRVA